MNILKNPIFLAIIASTLVFTVMYYWYNYMSESQNNDDKMNKRKRKDKKKISKYGDINETIVLSTAIAGIATWYIASSYFTEQNIDTNVDTNTGILDQKQQNDSSTAVVKKITTADISVPNTTTISGPGTGPGTGTGTGQKTISGSTNQSGGNKNIQSNTLKNSDDISRSYNLIGSGLNIPRSELNIPNVLIDYK